MEKDGLVEELFVQGHAKVAGDAASASSAPAAVSTASSVEEVSAMDGYDYLNDYISLWGICRYGTPMPVSLTFTPRGKLGQLVRSASVQNPVDGFEQQFKLTADDDTARNACLTEEKCRKLLALAGTAEGSFSGSLHRDGTLHFCLLPYLCGMDAARGIQGSNRSAFYNCHLTQPVV